MAGLTCFHTSVIFEVWSRFAVLTQRRLFSSRGNTVRRHVSFVPIDSPNDIPDDLDDVKVDEQCLP